MRWGWCRPIPALPVAAGRTPATVVGSWWARLNLFSDRFDGIVRPPRGSEAAPPVYSLFYCISSRLKLFCRECGAHQGKRMVDAFHAGLEALDDGERGSIRFVELGVGVGRDDDLAGSREVLDAR